MTAAGLAEQLRAATDPRVRWRLVREFLEEFRQEPLPHRQRLLDDRPAPVDPRWDAFLGALVEHLVFHARLHCPEWTLEEQRFLSAAWFLSDLPAARAAAMETSPASFRRRGILLDRGDLDVV
ncbi:MAG: hypothetical protein M3415_05975 [Actinomycetota bacterium]|nr:hypothetical protein [Actinomycetota bacterium]